MVSSRVQDASEARPATAHLLRRGNVILDVIHREIEVDGHRLPRLPPRRFDVFSALFRFAAPMGQADLLIEVWGEQGDIKAVQMTVARLREDLKNCHAIQIRTDAHTYELVISAAIPPAVR